MLKGDHSNCLPKGGAGPTRRTSAEKLERLRELMNEMTVAGAREPNDAAMQKLVRFAERGNRILDGDFE